MTGILAFGAYVPRLRLQRAAMVKATAWFNPALAAHAAGERAICSVDEDAITMAVEAARDCTVLQDRAAVSRVILASTTLPFADRQNAGIVKEALNLADGVATMDVTGSQRAGSSALVTALKCSDEGPVLCIGAERRRAQAASEAELINGDAAAAFLVGAGDTVADFLGSHSVSIDFVDHFRPADRAHDFSWESRWVRDEGYAKIVPPAIRAALAKFGLEAKDVTQFLMPAPVVGINHAMAKAAGIPAAAVFDCLQSRLGDSGTAHPLVMLASALESAKPGDTILIVSFGQGCDVLAVRATERIAKPKEGLGVSGWLARREPDDNYIRHLYWSGELDLDGGLRAEVDLKTPLSMLYRERKTILSLTGGKCRETGTVQFPKSRISVAQNARMVDTQDDYVLSDLPARVVTFTADRLGFSPNPPACYGMVEFDGGGRLVADFTDVGASGMKVGQPIRMMFRLKRNDDRGFKHYFWKAVPDYRQAL